MLKLHNTTALHKRRKEIGRGGKRGGTSGRGFGGQRARTSGAVRPGFEGGQMPLYRRLPKRGFNNAQFRCEVAVINLSQLNDVFENGAEVTVTALVEKGLLKRAKSNSVLVKILGSGELKKKLTVHADAFSKTAQEAIKAQGGQVRLHEEKVSRGSAE